MPTERSWRALPPAATAGLLALLAVCSVMALGGVFAYATGVLTICGGLLLLLAPLPTAPRQGARQLLWLGAFLALYTFLTLIPMPLGWLSRIAPAQASVWARALRPFGAVSPWGSLSLDPTATAAELGKLLLYGCTYVVVLGLAQRRHGTSWLERIVCAVTVLVVLVSLGHWALGESAVLGVYQPELVRESRHVTVLLNSNHLAEVMAIGGAVGAGVLVTERGRLRQVEGAVTLACATVGSAVAASRGGLVALVAGVAIALFGGRRRLDLRRARSMVLAVLVVGGLGVAVLATSERLTQEATSSDLEKLDIFRQSLPLLFRYGLLGIGRGAFESVSPEARRDLGSYVFTHPENLLLQWGIEWGVVVTAIAIVVVARALGPSVLRGRAVMPWGAYGALLAFALQNQVDFGSEVPAIGILVVCCVGLVTGGARAVPGQLDTPSRGRRELPRALGAVTAIVGAWVLLGADHELWVETRQLSRSVEHADFPAQLRAAMARHPAEAHLPFLGALRAQHDGKTVLPWVTRTLERSPVHGRAHLLLARELEQRQSAQARLEYRLAYTEDYRTRPAVSAATAHVVQSFDDAIDLLPRTAESVGSTDIAGGPTLGVPWATRIDAAIALAAAIRDRLPGSSDRILRFMSAAIHPTAGLVAPIAEGEVADVLRDEPWSSGAEEAREWVRLWVSLAPRDVAPRLAVARLVATTDAGRALTLLTAAESEVAEPAQLLIEASELAEEASLTREAAQLLERSVQRCSGTDGCVAVLTRGASLEERRGHPERALLLLRRKATLVPSDAGLWRQQATLAEQLGLYSESSEDLEQLLILVPGDLAATQSLERLRRASRARGLPKLPSD